MTFLGIDLGTSSLKALLVDESQAVLADSSVPIATSHPHPGWSEQDPEEWWQALQVAIAAIRASQPAAFRSVRAIGLSGQMHGAVLVDRDGAPLRPAILWNDSRAAPESAALNIAVPDLARIAGIIAMPGFTAPKLMWLRAQERESVDRAWKIISPKDFLRLKLTREAITDMSDAAGTLWLDQAARDWSDAVLAATGLGRSAMPDLVEGSAAAGNVRAELRSEWGIGRPVVVAGGAGDAAAASVGIGAVGEGDAFVSLGTSAQFFVADRNYRPQPDTLLHAFAHALPERWYRMAALLNGATCLQWVAGLVREKDIELLLGRAVYRGPSRVLFLPYLSGERTPHNDPHARGIFAGLDAGVGADDLVQAVLEGVAFSLLEAYRLLQETGLRLEAVAAVGGGARSRFWMQLLAHVLGIPLIRYSGSEKGPAFGAARLARLAATGEAAESVCVRPPVLDVLQPDPSLSAAYALRFEAYRKLYRGLRPQFRVGHVSAQRQEITAR